MFVRGGYVDPGDYLGLAGREGDYRSSVGSNNYFAYSLAFGSSNIYPSNNYYYRHNDFSIRCVALGG